MANSPPSARSVEKVCRIGLMSASPLVSISTRPKCGILPRSRSATSLRSAICRSVRVLQQRQPLPSSVTSSLLARSSASSMPSEPNSLTISAVPRPSGVSRKRRTSVVLPAPRKPVTIVTGSRDAALALLPPAEARWRTDEGKRSRTMSCHGHSATRSMLRSSVQSARSTKRCAPDPALPVSVPRDRPGAVGGLSADQKSISRQYSPPMWRSTQ